MVRFGHRDVAQARVVDGEPVREIALLLNDRYQRIVVGPARLGMHLGLDRQAADEGRGEAAMLVVDEPLRIDDHTRREIDDDRGWLRRCPDQLGGQLEEALDGSRCATCCVEGDALADKVLLVGVLITPR